MNPSVTEAGSDSLMLGTGTGDHNDERIVDACSDSRHGNYDSGCSLNGTSIAMVEMGTTGGNDHHCKDLLFSIASLNDTSDDYDNEDYNNCMFLDDGSYLVQGEVPEVAVDEKINHTILNHAHGIGTITSRDVLCGRDKVPFGHSGNKRFRVIIEMYRERYQNARSKEVKTKIIMDIIDMIKRSGGRFLKRRERNSNTKLENKQTIDNSCKGKIRGESNGEKNDKIKASSSSSSSSITTTPSTAASIAPLSINTLCYSYSGDSYWYVVDDQFVHEKVSHALRNARAPGANRKIRKPEKKKKKIKQSELSKQKMERQNKHFTNLFQEQQKMFRDLVQQHLPTSRSTEVENS